MPSKSKSKGSSFERTYATFLSNTFGSPFIRVPNSGAFIGGKNNVRKSRLDENQAKTFKGDIIAPDTWMNWNCECKSYADFPFHQLLSGNVKVLDSWIEQCMAVADDGDFSFIAFKISRKGTFVAVKNCHEGLTFSNKMVYNNSKFGEWIITDSDSFWKLNTGIIENICKAPRQASK